MSCFYCGAVLTEENVAKGESQMCKSCQLAYIKWSADNGVNPADGEVIKENVQ